MMRVKNPLYKRWWFWLLIILAGIGYLSNLSKNNKDIEKDQPSVVVEKDNSITPEMTPNSKEQSSNTISKSPSISPSTKKTSHIDVDRQNSTPNIISEADYVLNNNTMKFHRPNCSSVDNIKTEHRKDYHGTKEDVVKMGYNACKRCHP